MLPIARHFARPVMMGILLFSVHAADAVADTESSEWSFKIAPYAWLAGTGGVIVTDGEETDFELSFDDILELTTGGFGIGDAAELTWTLSLFVNWRFGKKWSTAFGWRTQSVDDISGSGAERNGSRIVTTGPIVGFVYSF